VTATVAEIVGNLSNRNPMRMKCCLASLVCLIAASSSLAQESADSPGAKIEILKLKWEKEIQLPRNFDPSVIPSNGAFADPARSAGANPAPTPALPATQSNPYVNFPAMPSRLPVSYMYSAKVRNLSAKTVKGIAWDYLFLDPNNNRVLGKHQFLSYEKILPSKSVTFHGRLRSPPVRLILASNTGKIQHPKLIEKAVIECVLYENQTVWRSAETNPTVCDLLKNKEALLNRKHGSAQSQ